MRTISFRQASQLPRAGDDLATTTHLEAVVPVPVPEHPMSTHFRICGANYHGAPKASEEIDQLNATAQRVSVGMGKDGLQVVVDGKYIAGAFKLHHDYSNPEQGEVLAANCATQTILKLAEGHQPSDMKLSCK
jgi:hypothetical protein